MCWFPWSMVSWLFFYVIRIYHRKVINQCLDFTIYQWIPGPWRFLLRKASQLKGLIHDLSSKFSYFFFYFSCLEWWIWVFVNSFSKFASKIQSLKFFDLWTKLKFCYCLHMCCNSISFNKLVFSFALASNASFVAMIINESIKYWLYLNLSFKMLMNWL